MRYGDFFRTGEYKGPGTQIENNYLYRAVQAPDGHIYVYFKGTSTTSYTQWKQNFAAAFRGQRVPEWDQVLNETRSRFGYQSSRVTYTGFSRGAVLAQYQGGTGYGLGRHPFPAYPPREGSKWARSFDPLHDAFLTEFLYTTSQPAMGKYGKRPADQTAVVQGGSKKPKPTVADDDRGPSSGRSPLHKDPRSPTGWIYYKDGVWYIYHYDNATEDPDSGTEWLGDVFDPDASQPQSTPTPTHPIIKTNITGDFSGLVNTFYNPVTSRIIGYKGIPRKRKFSSLQRYSPFWKEQMRLTQTSVLAGPS